MDSAFCEFVSLLGLYAKVSEEEAQKLFFHAEPRFYKKGEELIRKGAVSSDFFIIRKGVAGGFIGEGIREKVLFFAVKGDAVASIHSLFAGKRAVVSVKALSDMECFAVAGRKLERLFLFSHEIANWGRLLFEEELFSIERRCAYISGRQSAYERFCMFMRMRAAEQIRQIPLKYVASYLGMEPQTLSRCRRRFAKEPFCRSCDF